jgi:spermidine/putrescine transport system substrate-binding protein
MRETTNKRVATEMETEMISSATRQMVLSRSLPRRTFQRTLAVAGLAVVTMPLRVGPASADEQVTFYTLGGLAEKPLFKRYAAKYGAEPNVTFWGDEEEALTKLRSGFEPDVTYCGTYSVARWREAGVLQAIDPDRLSNWADLFDSLKSVSGAVADGSQWLAPMGWGTTSVLYRADLVDVKDESWALLWDERYKGRLAMIDGVADAVAGAAIYAGIDPYTMDESAIAKVKEVMVKQRPLLRFYTSDMTSLGQAIAAGEVVAAMTWNDAYAALRKQGVPVKYMFNPKEGVSAWVSCLVLNKSAADLDRAYALMDGLLDPDSGAFWVTQYGYGHANHKAYDLVTDEQLETVGLPRDVSSVLSRGIFQSRMRNEDEIVRMFEEVKAGIN